MLPMIIHKNKLGEMKLSSETMTIAKNISEEAFIREKIIIITRENSFDILSSNSCPTVVICSHQDNLSPLAQHQAIADEPLNEILLINKDCVRLSPIEQPPCG